MSRSPPITATRASNAIGTYEAFLEDDVELIGVDAGGEGLDSGRHGAPLTTGATRNQAGSEGSGSLRIRSMIPALTEREGGWRPSSRSSHTSTVNVLLSGPHPGQSRVCASRRRCWRGERSPSM